MMAVTNSVNPLQGNNLTSLTKKINENTQQAEGAAAADFAQQLAKAGTALNPAEALASVGSALTDIKPAADMNFDLNSAAALSGGLGANDFLSQALKGGIETKFNELRKEIASSLIAGLAGEDSATARTVDTPENTPALPEDGVTTGSAENAGNTPKSVPAASAEGMTTANNEKSSSELSEADPITEAPQAVNEPALTSSLFPEALLNLFKSTPDTPLLDKEESDNLNEQKTASSDEEQMNSLDEQKAVG